MGIMQEEIKQYWEKATPMNFKEEKWTYEQKRKFRYDLQDYMHDVFEFDKYDGKIVLDIGCGAGIDSMEFARNGAEVWPIDITENAVNLTKQLSVEAGYPMAVQRYNGVDLPFCRSMIDAIFSYGVLHHVPEIDNLMDEIARVLKPGGKFMAMVYNRDSLLFAHSILHRGLDEGEPLDYIKLASRYSERNLGCPYTKCYTKQEALEYFSRYFKDVTVSVHYNVIDLVHERKVKINIPDKYELGWHLVVKGMK